MVAVVAVELVSHPLDVAADNCNKSMSTGTTGGRDEHTRAAVRVHVGLDVMQSETSVDQSCFMLSLSLLLFSTSTSLLPPPPPPFS